MTQSLWTRGAYTEHKEIFDGGLNFSAISHHILNMNAFEGKSFTHKKSEEVHKDFSFSPYNQTLHLRNKRGERENGRNIDFFDCTGGWVWYPENLNIWS